MFGLGWAEIMVAAVVGLIVIGPKELPVVFRKIGQFVGKAKGMARDFSRAMNDAADDSGMKDAMDSMNSLQDGVRSVADPTTKWKDFEPGPETSKLADERTEKANKMHDSMADKAQVRLDSIKVASEAVEIHSTPKETSNTASKKPAVKKPVRSKKPMKKVTAQKNTTASPKIATTKTVSNKAAPKSGKTS
tara:strand:- start:869 stop:1441 length:573 start_codon:yes stop_codon:yes gene_type:complete